MSKRFSKDDPKIGTIVYDSIDEQDMEVVDRFIYNEQKWYLLLTTQDVDLGHFNLVIRSAKNVKALG